MEPNKFSKKLLKRLPAYLDYLKSLPEEVENISATTMAKSLELGEVQVRKDLACISNTGRQKVGRPRQQLIAEIEDFLDLATKTGAVVVGMGNLGQALLEYSGFSEFGMNVMAGFDLQPVREQSEQGKPIYPMTRLETFCRRYQGRIGIIAVPADSAQDVCDSLIACGVEAIWNFAPVRLLVPEHVIVKTENLATALTTLRVELRRQENQA